MAMSKERWNTGNEENISITSGLRKKETAAYRRLTMHRSASKMRRPFAFMSTQNVILHDEVVMSTEDEGLVNLMKNV